MMKNYYKIINIITNSPPKFYYYYYYSNEEIIGSDNYESFVLIESIYDDMFYHFFGIRCVQKAQFRTHIKDTFKKIV